MEENGVMVKLRGLNDLPIMESETAVFSRKPEERQQYIEMYLRYNKEHNKLGYFTVGYELINRLYMNLLSHGYRITNKDQKGLHRIRPDKSAQEPFHKFLCRKYIDLSQQFEYGELVDSDDEFFRVLHYKNKYLPDFIDFFEKEWLLTKGVSYFRKREPNALPFLAKLTEVFITPEEKSSAV